MGELIQINGPDKNNKFKIGSAQWKEDRLRSLPYWDELKESTPNWEKYLEPKGNFIERTKSSKIDNQESSYFFEEIRNLIPKEQWLYLMSELERIDLNSEETVDIDGRQYKDQEPEAVYIDLAADLKEIDEEEFEKNVVDKRKKWLKFRNFLDSRREDINNFLHYAYNLKILYPQKFLDGEFNLDGKILDRAVKRLRDLLEEKNWGEFTNIYNKAFYLFGDRLTDRGFLDNGTRLGKEIKRSIFSRAISFLNKNEIYSYARVTALSKPILEGNIRELHLTTKQWQLVKEGIVDDIRGGIKIWDVIRKIRILKEVQVR